MVKHLTSGSQAVRTHSATGAPNDAATSANAGSAGPSVPLYDVIMRRRDVRGEFTGAPVDPTVLRRLLEAAHAAPSVGLSQPWDFVVVTDPDLRRDFYKHVESERSTFAATLEGERAETFAGIKIDGVLEASLSVVVTYDSGRGSPNVLGRHAIADAGLYSVCLAIENLWLACTAEGWGMGWVSFYEESFLSKLLGIPAPVRPVAWLCMGPVSSLAEVPDLERHGWRERLPLEDVLHSETWDGPPAPDAPLIGGGLK
jgi:5,6-dimethylbenzimidazole synthase